VRTETKQELTKILKVAVALIAAYLLFLALYHICGLPEPTRVQAIALSLLQDHGYVIVYTAALIEGLLLIGWYLPGSLVLVLAVVAARNAGLHLPFVITLIIAGFFTATIINYALGKYGWYHILVKFGLKAALEKTRKKVEQKEHRIIFPSYFHPNIGNLVAVSCGILQLNFAKFAAYSFLATVFWNTLFGALVVLLGDFALKLLHPFLLVGIVILWMILQLVRKIRRQKQ